MFKKFFKYTVQDRYRCEIFEVIVWQTIFDQTSQDPESLFRWHLIDEQVSHKVVHALTVG